MAKMVVREKVLRVRLTEQEMKAIQKGADKSGVTVSEYIRVRVLVK